MQKSGCCGLLGRYHPSSSEHQHQHHSQQPYCHSPPLYKNNNSASADDSPRYIFSPSLSRTLHQLVQYNLVPARHTQEKDIVNVNRLPNILLIESSFEKKRLVPSSVLLPSFTWPVLGLPSSDTLLPAPFRQDEGQRCF
jgi:hypothetical protein